MAIIKGAINFGSNFNIGAKGPIDARQRVETIADLTTVWTADIPAYKGMVVSVLEDNSIYILKGDDATVPGNWKKIGDVSGDITNLQEQITANKAEIDTINGTGDGSIKKAVSDAKTELIGDAAAEYNTLGKLEDKIQAEALRADTAEKANATAAAAAKDAADAASAKVDTEIGKLNSTVYNEAASAGDAASAQIKVTVEESKGKLTGVTVNAPSFESAGAAATVKTELLGETGVSGNTIISAKEDAAAAKTAADNASKKVDTEIGKLDVAGNVSEAVKGVTVTVDETDGKVIKPVVSIADGTLTGAATDGNLVTGTVVKKYVDDKVSEINTAAGTLSGRVGTLEGKVDKLDATHTTKGDGSFNTVAEEVTTGIAGIAETSKSNTAGSDVVVTVTTKSGSVSSVAVDSSVLKKAVTDEVARAEAAEKKNADAIAAETTRATTAEKKNADAIAAETTRAMAAEEKVKTDLLGSATDDYNTLGKLEGKIKAADAKAVAAQTAADSKIKSVTGNTTVIAATDVNHDVSVSLKTSDKGNVKFTQDIDGLSANVTIPEATVTGVKAGDKVLALDGTELTSTISLSVDTSADGEGKKYIRLKGIDDADLGKIDIADFVKDGMLTDAELVTNPAGQSAGTYIKLTWNTDGGKQPMYINVTSLIDIYTAKHDGGLVLDEDHAFSVDTTKIATVESVNGVTSRVSTLEGKVATIEGEGEGSIKKAVADEASRAKAAEKANADAIAAEVTRAKEAEAAVKTDLIGNADTDTKESATIAGAKKYTDDAKSALIGTSGDDATKDTIKGAKQAVKDLEAQIKADAVTLTIPENDPYITASKAEGSNTYTISSKLDTDNKTPLVDVKIDDKLTKKINSLNKTGNTSDAARGVTVTVNETAGMVSKPIVEVTPGEVAAGNASVVTGGAVYTAINAALVWNDIPTTA